MTSVNDYLCAALGVSGVQTGGSAGEPMETLCEQAATPCEQIDEMSRQVAAVRGGRSQVAEVSGIVITDLVSRT